MFSLTLIALGLTGSGAGIWYLQGGNTPATPYRTAPVERGTLLACIGSTGAVQAENVVDVGAQNQVPLQIKSFGPDLFRQRPENDLRLYAALATTPAFTLVPVVLPPSKPIDFCSPVRRGQVLAQLDQAIYQFQKDQAEAEVANATYAVRKLEADLLQQHAKLKQATNDWERAQKLRGVISALDYDAAQASFGCTRAIVDAGNAALHQAEKALDKAQAMLRQAETNLSYTTIKSPINGIVIDRRVNVGQTVVSGLTASSLFLIAEDLRRLEVWASVNEADIGGIRKDQHVRFTVDAFPNESFYGEVKEIRLNAQMTQNVVTFPVVVTVDNSSGRLMPYMTANLQFEVNQHDDAVLVPNAALRWKPQVQSVVPEAREEYVKSLHHHPTPKKDKHDGDRDKQARGTVWVTEGAFVRPVRLKLGLTDGTHTEILGEGLEEGKELVIGTVAASSADGTVNPFAPQVQQQRK
jgi:HlyD family secretion protein